MQFGADLPDPFYLFNILHDYPGSGLRATNPAAARAMRRAAGLTGHARYRAYARVELTLVKDVVPEVIVARRNERSFVSRRVGCKIFYPELDLTAVCLR